MRKKTRKLRRLTIDVPKFLADYNDAVETGITVREFCELSGLHIATLHSRIETLAKRGVILPLLNGMRAKTRMGKRLGLLAAAPKRPPKPVAKSHAIDYERLAAAVVRRLAAGA